MRFLECGGTVTETVSPTVIALDSVCEDPTSLLKVNVLENDAPRPSSSAPIVIDVAVEISDLVVTVVVAELDTVDVKVIEWVTSLSPSLVR